MSNPAPASVNAPVNPPARRRVRRDRIAALAARIAETLKEYDCPLTFKEILAAVDAHRGEIREVLHALERARVIETIPVRPLGRVYGLPRRPPPPNLFVSNP